MLVSGWKQEGIPTGWRHGLPLAQQDTVYTHVPVEAYSPDVTEMLLIQTYKQAYDCLGPVKTLFLIRHVTLHKTGLILEVLMVSGDVLITCIYFI